MILFNYLLSLILIIKIPGKENECGSIYQFKGEPRKAYICECYPKTCYCKGNSEDLPHYFKITKLNSQFCKKYSERERIYKVNKILF